MTDTTSRGGLAHGGRTAVVVRAISAAVILAMLFVATWYASPGDQTVSVQVPLAGAGHVPAPGPAADAGVADPASGDPAAPPPSVPAGAPVASVTINPGASGGPAPAVAPAAVPGASVEIGGSPGAVTEIAGLQAAPIGDQAPCPLGWPKPERQGGLASLIGLAPAAGPFSSEAFALGSVYQPLLQLVGPLLAEIEPVITANLPWINPLIEEVQAVEAVVLEAILPFYGPYRGQLLAAEGDIAAVLTPILLGAYQSPAAACLVAWQGQIISAAGGGPITVASLSRPGQTVRLEAAG